MGLLSSLKSIGTKVLDTVAGVVQNPLTAITKGTGASTEKFLSNPISTRVAKTVINLGTTALAVATAGSSSVASTVAKLIPSTIKGKVAAVIAAPIVYGAVVKQPEKTFSIALETPSSLSNFGGNVADFAADPSLQTAKDIVTENPLISGGLALAGVGTAGLALAPAVSGFLTRQELKEQTALLENISGAPADQVFRITEKEAIASQAPITPQTQEVSTKTPTKRKRKARKAVLPSISQKVNVIVSNKSSSSGNKKYINRSVLVNR